MMKAVELYDRLSTDFDISGCSDNWEGIDLGVFLYPMFRDRWIGLALDNAHRIERVFTAVFPSDRVLEQLLATDALDALLFVHHPMIWDLRKAPQVFSNIAPHYLPQLEERRISL